MVRVSEQPPEHLQLFKDYLNQCHKNMSFTSESELNNSMSFLDVRIEREGSSFVTSVYRKPTFSGVYSHFDSFIPISYKFVLVSTLIFRCFSICSDMSKFHLEVENLKFIFRKNGYASSFIDSCIKKAFK